MKGDHYVEWDIGLTGFGATKDGTDAIGPGAFSTAKKWHVLGLFAAELEDVINDAWGSGHTVSWSDVSLSYTIDGLDDGAAYEFNAAARHILGLSNASHDGVTEISTDVRPWYVVRPFLPDVSSPSHEYESGGVASLAVSDGGIPFGVARTTAPLHKRWTCEYEPRAQMLAHYVMPEIPFTWQHFIEHARTVHTIALVTSTTDTIIDGLNAGKLTPDHASFTQSVRGRHVDGHDDYWWIELEMVTTGIAGVLPADLIPLLTEDGYLMQTEADELLLVE